MDILASTQADFGPAGWEVAEDFSAVRSAPLAAQIEPSRKERTEAGKEDLERSMRRARANVRRIALANDFRWFVTLTLNPDKVDTMDGRAVVKKLNAWCSNAVQRHGLKYVLVPERHKKGGIHFHGFFSDSLDMVDSGTIRPASGGRPRRPRSRAERDRMIEEGGQIVYNIPGWSLGFTTAMELWGEYPKAVAYVCKYIGKDGEKPAGRWYYSGGELAAPKEEYAELDPRELKERYKGQAIEITPPGKRVVIVNGIVLNQVQEER